AGEGAGTEEAGQAGPQELAQPGKLRRGRAVGPRRLRRPGSTPGAGGGRRGARFAADRLDADFLDAGCLAGRDPAALRAVVPKRYFDEPLPDEDPPAAEPPEPDPEPEPVALFWSGSITSAAFSRSLRKSWAAIFFRYSPRLSFPSPSASISAKFSFTVGLAFPSALLRKPSLFLSLSLNPGATSRS